MDGSIYSAMTNEGAWKTYSKMRNTMLSGNIVFISKTSTSKQLTGKSQDFADMFYYNATNQVGYSKPRIDFTYGVSKGILSCYVRLTPYAQILKLEMLADNSNSELELEMILHNIIDNISGCLVNSYPYSLRISHENVEIKKSDIEDIMTFFKLNVHERERGMLK